MTMHILLIENSNLNEKESLRSELEDQDFQVTVTHTPKTAVQKIESLWPNLVIFNLGNEHPDLPKIQKTINKAHHNIPNIVISDAENLIEVLNTDTFFADPGDSKDLARAVKKATIRQKDRFIRFPGLVLDCHQRQLLRNDQIFHLTPKEFKLLQLLIEHQNQDLSRKTIMKHVWETDYMGDTRTLDVHIRWLREKIEENPSRPRRLITIRGVGYRFLTNPE